MQNKLYNSHSFLFPILRYSQGKVYPEYSISFTSWGDTPFSNFNVGDWLPSSIWCPIEISPSRALQHNSFPPIECNRIVFEGYPFKKCHDLKFDEATQEDLERFHNIHWSYGVQDYEANITGVKVEDVIVGEFCGLPYRQYKITAEGFAQWIPCNLAYKSDEESEDNNKWPMALPQVLDYSLDASVLDNGDILFSASVHTVNPVEDQLKQQQNPLFLDIHGDSFIVGNKEQSPIGQKIFIPAIPILFTCSDYKLWKENDSFNKPYWHITYQCSGIFPASLSTQLPNNIVSDLAYEINGEVLRSVSGKVIVAKHSNVTAGRKKIFVYSMSQVPIYPLGSLCLDGVAISDIPHKETKSFRSYAKSWNEAVQKNIFEVTELTVYKHEIEVIF